MLVLASSRETGRGPVRRARRRLACVELGRLGHVVVIGAIRHESVSYFHPKVELVPDIDEWLVGAVTAGPAAG